MAELEERLPSIKSQTSKPQDSNAIQDSFSNEFEQDGNPDSNSELKRAKPNAQKRKSSTKQLSNKLAASGYSKIQSIGDLRRVLKEKINQVNEAKNVVNQKRKKMKDIQNQIDKSVAKTFSSYNKPPSVNIRAIFSKSDTNVSQNQTIARLQDQLKGLRKSIHEEKQKTNKLEEDQRDPVTVKNNEQAKEIIAIINFKENRIQELIVEKKTLLTQIERLKKFHLEQYVENIEEERSMFKEQISQYTKEFNSKKSQIYQIDKEDRMISEKTRFIQEVMSLLSDNVKETQENLLVQRKETEQTIKNLGNEIRQLNDQMLKIQFERNNQLKSLALQCEHELKGKLEREKEIRNIDSYFMKISLFKRANQRKLEIEEKRRAEIAKQEEKEEKHRKDKNQYISSGSRIKEQKQASGNLQMINQVVTETDNEKLEQQKKSYQFGINYQDSEAIIANDEFLGKKLTLRKISLVKDKQYIYGIRAMYTENNNQQVEGYNILSKVIPSKPQQLILQLGLDQALYKFSIGFNQQALVKYLELETSLSNRIEWGNKSDCKDICSEQIEEYKFISLKGAIKNIPDKGANDLCLVGLGFSTVRSNNAQK